MPPKNKLSDAEIATLTEWVKLGAPDPRTNSQPQLTKSEAKGKDHWAYQSLRKIPPPETKNANWARSDIDRFILGALESRNIAPLAEADRATLLRRAYFDLIGLPPTPQQA